MPPLSIVILAHNEAHNIARCVQSLVNLSDDILVIENGSMDDTAEIALQAGARVIKTEWKGYSETKNFGNREAKHDWILSLDADEVPNELLIQSIKNLFEVQLEVNKVFAIQRKMVYCGMVLHHGSVGNEFRVRLFNRHFAKWNTNTVHEELHFLQPKQIEQLNGFLWHYSYRSVDEHRLRLAKYAQLSAKQMFESGKQANFTKMYCSAPFSFIKNYFLKGGFLDGIIGLQFALNEMWYVKLKYQLLQKML